MSTTGFVVLFAVIWFIALWVVLPIGLQTQGEAGERVKGTPISAPANLRLGRKLMLATLLALCVWLPIIGLIIWSGVTIQDIDPWKWLGR